MKPLTTSKTTDFKQQNYESFLRQLTVTEIVHKFSGFTKPQISFAEAYRSCLESLSSSSHFRPYFHRNQFNNIVLDSLQWLALMSNTIEGNIYCNFTVLDIFNDVVTVCVLCRRWDNKSQSHC
jgi:hypothetical protein